MAGSEELILNLTGITIILITSIMMLITAIKGIMVYKENKRTQPLITAFQALFVGIAMIFLSFEKLFLSIVLNEFIVIFFGGIAIIWSIFTIVTFDCFAFNVAFLEKYKKLTGFVSIFGCLLLYFGGLTQQKQLSREK